MTRTRFRGYRTPGRRPRPGVFICRTTGTRGDRGFHDTWRCTPGPRSRGKSGVVAGRASSDGHPPRPGRATRAWGVLRNPLAAGWHLAGRKPPRGCTRRGEGPAAGRRALWGRVDGLSGFAWKRNHCSERSRSGRGGRHCSGRWSGRSVTVRPGLFGGLRAPSGSAWPSPWRSPSRPAGRSADLCGAASGPRQFRPPCIDRPEARW